MGRAAQAIKKLQDDNTALTTQLAAANQALATAQANAQDTDDIAAEDAVLGPVTPVDPNAQKQT